MAVLDDIELPEAPSPVGQYERAMIHGGIGFLSGQFPIVGGRLLYCGRVGAEITIDQAQEAAEAAALNALAQIRIVLARNTQRFLTLLRLEGYVASVDQFTDQPVVLDGASATFLRLLGEQGRHARTAFSVPRLPLDSPIELAVTFAVTP